MRAYQNNNLNVTYPFLQAVPFPLDFIQDIKIALKVQAVKIFITLVAHVGTAFYIQLQTQNTYLGKFQTQSSWLTLNNQNVFGCIRLGALQTQQFNYSGRWEIQRACYTLPTPLKGLQKAFVGHVQLPASEILDIQLSGDLSLRQDSDSTILNIGRDSDTHTDYSAVTVSQQTNTGILTVNGMQVNELSIIASGQVYVSPVIEVSDNNYVIYIYTDKLFPNCDQSDSASGV